jgi:type II secretory pathway component PulK
MRKNNGGFAVVAVLVGVAVAATLLIASYGRSSSHAQDQEPGAERTAAGVVAASDAASAQAGFALTPQASSSEAASEAASVAQRSARQPD